MRILLRSFTCSNIFCVEDFSKKEQDFEHIVNILVFEICSMFEVFWQVVGNIDSSLAWRIQNFLTNTKFLSISITFESELFNKPLFPTFNQLLKFLTHLKCDISLHSCQTFYFPTLFFLPLGNMKTKVERNYFLLKRKANLVSCSNLATIVV